MNIFRKIKAWLRLNAAVIQADKAHACDGARFYVVPKGEGAKLLIMDRRNFRLLKMKGYIDPRAKVMDLEKDCFYCTPHRDGSGRLPDEVVKMKRAQYWRWAELMDAARRARAVNRR